MTAISFVIFTGAAAGAAGVAGVAAVAGVALLAAGAGVPSGFAFESDFAASSFFMSVFSCVHPPVVTDATFALNASTRTAESLLRFISM
jgi:hypothetical protein